MAQGDDAGLRRREPLLLGLSGALIGVLLAVALVVFGLGGTDGTATASPTALPQPSAAPTLTAEGSPSTGPSEGLPPSPEVTLAPTAAPPTAAPTKTPRPTPTPNTNPVITKFTIPSVVDCTKTAPTIHIAWTVRRATGVTLSIDGGGLYQAYSGTSGSDDVPFGCSPNVRTHTYTLRTTGGTGPAASITKSVKWGAMKIVSFSMGPNAVANCPTDSGMVGIDLNFEVKYATGAELEHDGQLYSTYSQKVVHMTGINYDCTKAQQVFTLTTTGGYGTPAKKMITVTDGLP